MVKKENINVIITGSGAPGIAGTIYSLKEENDFIEVKTIGTDISDSSVGRYFCDYFYLIPSFRDTDSYIDALIEISKKHSVKVIIPQNTLELSVLTDKKDIFQQEGIQILLSSDLSIEKANNKYELLKVAKKINIPYPLNTKVKNITELENAMSSFGWPKNKIVIKPPVSNGSRGVRIIDESIDLTQNFFSEKPGSLFINFEAIKLTLNNSFDELLVMEYLDGQEYTVDFIRTNVEQLVIPRRRKEIKYGITFSGVVEKNLLIEKYSTMLADDLDLKYCFGFQYIIKDKIPYIIECNPRVQGSMVISTLANANIILNSVLSILEKPLIPMRLEYGTLFNRYWGGISNYKTKIKKI